MARKPQRAQASFVDTIIERYLVCPLSRLLATAQVRSGDVLFIDWHPGEKGLAFLMDNKPQSSYGQMPVIA
jgi:hypothetical protein